MQVDQGWTELQDWLSSLVINDAMSNNFTLCFYFLFKIWLEFPVRLSSLLYSQILAIIFLTTMILLPRYYKAHYYQVIQCNVLLVMRKSESEWVTYFKTFRCEMKTWLSKLQANRSPLGIVSVKWVWPFVSYVVSNGGEIKWGEKKCLILIREDAICCTYCKAQWGKLRFVILAFISDLISTRVPTFSPFLEIPLSFHVACLIPSCSLPLCCTFFNPLFTFSPSVHPSPWRCNGFSRCLFEVADSSYCVAADVFWVFVYDCN